MGRNIHTLFNYEPPPPKLRCETLRCNTSGRSAATLRHPRRTRPCSCRRSTRSRRRRSGCSQDSSRRPRPRIAKSKPRVVAHARRLNALATASLSLRGPSRRRLRRRGDVTSRIAGCRAGSRGPARRRAPQRRRRRAPSRTSRDRRGTQ